METDQFKFLSESVVEDIIGKPIHWHACGYHRHYEGVAIIRGVDYSSRKPIICEHISGDELKYAFLDDHGLESTDGGETYRATKKDFCFSYSDGDREICFKICE